jgi:2-polyprenyl-3-methyl-5-hydroxy-6-metoxy-1,4-benzoquinol methylase
VSLTFSAVVDHCPICDHGKFEYFGGRWQFGHRLSYYVCCYCGFVFQSPRMSDREAAEFYSADYRRLYDGREEPTSELLQVQKLRAKHLASIVEGQLGSAAARCLDIGCSTGELLKEIRRALPHCSVYGVEPSQAHRAFCRTQGIDVYQSLEDLQERQQTPQFGLVTMSHVLEHISHPVDYLTRLRTHFIAPEGWLLVEVPNLFGHGSFQVAHPLCFSRKSLSECLLKAGYEPRYWKVHNCPRTDDPRGLFLTVMARAAKSRDIQFRPKRVHPSVVRWCRRTGHAQESYGQALSHLVRSEIGRLVRAKAAGPR